MAAAVKIIIEGFWKLLIKSYKLFRQLCVLHFYLTPKMPKDFVLQQQDPAILPKEQKSLWKDGMKKRWKAGWEHR